MKKSAYSVAVVGATGLVGAEIIAVLEERRFPIAELLPYASLRTAGDEVRCGDVTARITPLDDARFGDTDFVFLAAGEQVSAEWVERATASGAIAIDTTQLFAGDPDVPLVVPDVNPAAITEYATRNLIASPAAPAIALGVVLQPLHAAAALRRVVASTFEPVSGAGRAGIEELQRQTVELMNGRSVENELFPRRIAFNIVPQIGEFLAGGVTRDEQQTVSAVRRLLDDPELAVSVTRVRTPHFYGTGLAANVETDQKLAASEAQEILRGAPGVLLEDDATAERYSTAADIVGQGATHVGRIREDPSLNVLDLWVVIDNIRKGSAINAVQIAELLIRDHL
jgi:aspartate-semialdehyde dehydrogenase